VQAGPAPTVNANANAAMGANSTAAARAPESKADTKKTVGATEEKEIAP